MRSTKQHFNYWKNRKINWKDAYLSTHSHPHRKLVIEKLKKMNWISCYELGCASGPNLYAIQKEFPTKHLGGMDINKDAIETANQLTIALNKEFKTKIWPLEVDNIQNGIFLSDDGSDIILTDMFCIYLSPFKIKKVLKEIKRVARFNIIFVEFHSKSFWQRFKLWITSGYFAHNWQKLLEQMDFYDIIIEKIKEEDWPGGNPQKDFAYLIVARK